MIRDNTCNTFQNQYVFFVLKEKQACKLFSKQTYGGRIFMLQPTEVKKMPYIAMSYF